MSTDLKPGDIARHAEHGYGLVFRAFASHETYILRADPDREGISTGVADEDLPNWERVETVKPGHVQVRVDDLDLSGWEGRNEWDYARHDNARLAIRVAKTQKARDEKLGCLTETPEPVKLSHPEPTEFGAKAAFTFSSDGCTLRFLRVNDDDDQPWQSENGLKYPWGELAEWDGERGSLTLGWDE